MTARHRARDDLAWLLLRHGYGFSEELRRRRRLGPPSTAPAVAARLGASPVVLLGGPAGVAAFTDTARFSRAGAMPAAVADVLFGHGAVHGLDDEAHHRRKELFVEALGGAAVDDLVRRVAAAWSQRVRRVRDGDRLVVQQASARLVGRAALEWAGIDVPSAEAAAASDRFAAIVDGFASPGVWARARVARDRSDRWARDLVERTRDGRLTPAPGSALGLVARWPDVDGRMLPAPVAAVDLQNLLRPAVAASRLVAFAALALVGHPHWARALREEHATGAASLAEGARGPVATAVAREVRRLSPFVPLLAARARTDQEVLGLPLPTGRRVLLDVVGTLRDPVTWPEPMRFSPDRFLDGSPVVPDALVPQGGGSVVGGHRCPGEDPVLGILTCSSTALALVADRLAGRRRPVDERRIPAVPPDGVPLRLRRPLGAVA